MNRYLFLLHRYLGIGLGLLVAIWCLSGIVMMYVEYPELSPDEAAAALQPLSLRACCRLPRPLAAYRDEPLAGLRVEMIAATPVLRLEFASGTRHTIDLASGSLLAPLDAADAGRAADAFATTAGIGNFSYEGAIERDQWTVYGAYDVHRPLHKFAGSDGAGTQWYISSRTGEVVQITTAHERFWNWLGAVPHWLYPTLLRQHTAIWAQLVIWLTIAATFLTVLGIYVGLRQFKARRSGRYSPYRGAALWHHYAGLAFGILMFTWLVSGFFSMNPWGLLQGRSFDDERARQRGADLVLNDELVRDLESLASFGLPADTVRLEGHMIDGRRFFAAWNSSGQRVLTNETLDEVLPFTQNAIFDAARRIRPSHDVATEGWIDEDDAYYFSHHEKRPLPVYRIVYLDGERFYLDPLTGAIVYAADASRQSYRWLHYALHRADFSAFIRARPVWDLFVLPLMFGVSLSALTGAWIGIRRVRRALGVQTRTAATRTGPAAAALRRNSPPEHLARE
jgi:hypothetical protein